MPYKSVAQRKFMHAKHPQIAAKWDKETGGKIAKSRGEGWLKPVIAGTVAGGLANQFPRVQDIEREHRRKKKGRVKKYLYEEHVHSDDPEFNHEAARKTFDLVMKMDDDSAEMFTTMVAGEIFETDVEKNLRTLQRHLDEVLYQRVELVKKAMMATIAKGHHEGAKEAAAALEEIEKAVVNPYIAGLYEFKESDFRRDPHSGQFRSKIKHNQKAPFSNKVANGMGLVPHDPAQRMQYARLTKEQKAQYQDEYRQLAGFLNVASQSTGADGDRQVHLRFADQQGNEFRVRHMGGAGDANHLLLNPHYTLLEADATPTTLTAGGAAFSLAHALGAQPGDRTGQRMEMANTALDQMPTFGAQWRAAPPDMKASNERLYNRVGTTGSYVGAIAPGTKVAAAAKLAEVVGSHGAEAEAVIGPTARKTAYRYRGTEKKPDAHIVALYGRAIASAKSTGGVPDQTELYVPRAGEKPRADELGMRRSGTRVHPKGGGPVAPSISQMGAARAKAMDRPPTRSELAQGRKVIVQQLRRSPNFPKGELYNLQSESGNLPPSEGIILNKDGQIVTQAVGYGDDHYLPFNLKNLKALKGGEYVRTRSVGGLTSEDIYTGLISGARRVTVTSRSGTFSIEFEQDFRGGRRYNDKALRMTRRYEQLLDAVQSNKVSTGDVPAPVRQAIQREVAQEYPGERGPAIKAKVQSRIMEYQEDPDFTPEDEKIMRLVAEQGMKDHPSRDEVEWSRAARNMVMAGKAGNYKLNAKGYEAAQDALAEQFPYYIKSHPVITKEDETFSGEKDKGYVEPGRNRPTAVRAGLFGTEANAVAGGSVGSEKFSASQADYQRGRIGPGQGDRVPHQRAANPQTEATEEAAATPETTAAGAPTPVDQAARQAQYQDSAVNLFTEIQQLPLDPASRLAFEDVIGLADSKVDPGAFATAIQDPEHNARFNELVERLRSHLSSPSQRSALQAYAASRGDLNAVAFDPRMALYWTTDPMTFQGEGYQTTDSDAQRDTQIQAIDNRTRSVTTGLPLSEVARRGDEAMKNELSALRQVYQEVDRNPAVQDPNNIDMRRQVAQRIFKDHYDNRAIDMIVGAKKEDLLERITDVHRMRALKAHYQGSWDRSVAVRPSAPNSVGQAMSDVEKQAVVRQRVEALRRWRYGHGLLDVTPGDKALVAAEELQTLIESGETPSEVEIGEMLAKTQHAYETLPDRHNKLDLGERGLAETRSELFEQDDEGYLRRKNTA
jgi:hypothetical protein